MDCAVSFDCLGRGCEMLNCPRILVPSLNSAPNTSLSSVNTAGTTLDPDGMPATFENRKMAAGKLPKNVRAPAKKKLPIEPPRKLNAGCDCDCRIPLCLCSTWV